jgi:CRISPR-associated protein Csb2
MALTLSLRFPTERYVAAAMHNRDELEWPPHPARLMLGLLATHYRHSGSPDERAALQWLCEQAPPEVFLPPENRCIRETMAGVYVPQNPAVAKSRAHPRKARSFPSLIFPEDLPIVVFHWPAARAEECTLTSLNRLLKDFSRFGHSSSLIAAEILPEIPAGLNRHLLPLETDSPATPDFLLRVPWSGLLASAETAFAAGAREQELSAAFARRDALSNKTGFHASSRGRYDPRHLYTGYSEKQEATEFHSPWDSRIFVFRRRGGDRLHLDTAWDLTAVLHKTMLDRWHRKFPDRPIPCWVSGHQSGGTNTAPLAECHLAMFPLPFIGGPYADGGIKGIGLAFPRKSADSERRALREEWRDLLGALLQDGPLELAAGNHSWKFALGVHDASQDLVSLRSSSWTSASTHWSSVTPVVLDRHPKPSFEKDPERWVSSCGAIVASACQRAGLPEPVNIRISRHSKWTGVPPASAFLAPQARPGRPLRYHIHAEIEFADAVTGPILLGAGRFRGYGLMKPTTPGI